MANYFRNENLKKLRFFYILTKSKTFYKTDTAFIFSFHFKYKWPFYVLFLSIIHNIDSFFKKKIFSFRK